MGYIEDLSRAAHLLLEAEIRLRTFKAQLDGIDREIALLNNLEAQLEENIRWLKRRKIITVASEYKKALEALDKARQRRSLFRIDRETCLKSCKNATMYYDKFKADHDHILELMHNPKNNVIYVDFRKQNG